jgi:hypothetical protein
MHSLATTACAVLIALPVAGQVASQWSASQWSPQSRQACTEIAEGGVTILPHGFLVTHLDEFVSQEEVKLSPDSRFWHCATGGTQFSLLVPRDAY